MRLFEIEEFGHPSGVYKFVEENCKQYIEQHPEWKTKPLFRGLNVYGKDYLFVESPVNRKPLTSTEHSHNMFVDAFKEARFIANRDNSIFCIGSSRYAKHYGKVWVVFPFDGFKFTWSPEVSDLFYFYNKENKTYEGWLNFIKQNYKEDDLPAAIDSKNEIMMTGRFLMASADWLGINIHKD